MSYQISTLNVNGLRENSKRQKLFNHFKCHSHDIIFLQETHCKDESESLKWGKEWGGESIWNNGSSQSRGVAILFKKNLDVDVRDILKDNEGRLMSVSATFTTNSTTEYHLTNVYVPNNSSERKRFLKKTETILQNIDTQSHIIGGDFNCVARQDLDRNTCATTDTSLKHDEGESELINLQNALSLEDVWRRRHPNQKMYTFSRGNSKSRIDLLLCSKAIDGDIDAAKIMPCIFSDHDAVEIRVNVNKVERGPGMWMFNSSLLSDPHYTEIINKFWPSWQKQKSNFSTLCDWWEMAKHNIKVLTINYSKTKISLSQSIKRLETKLGKLKEKQSTADTLKQINDLQNEISDKYKEQYDAYRLRSKAECIEKNETSSKYFFNLEKQRGKNKLWSKIKTEAGETFHGINAILKEQTRFYKQLFTSESINEELAHSLLTNLVK